jgi:hypothetical protein
MSLISAYFPAIDGRPTAVLTPSALDAIFSSGRSSIADGFGKSNFILVRLFWEA